MFKPIAFKPGKLAVVVGTRRRNLVVRWNENESFSHWLLKVIVVAFLLNSGFSPGQVKLEKFRDKRRIDIIAKRGELSLWFECETRIDPESYSKFKQMKRLAKKVGFKGRAVIVHFYQSYYAEYVINMPTDIECWFANVIGWHPEIFFGIRKMVDKTILLIGSSSKSYTRRCSGLKYRKHYDGYQELI